MLNVDCRNKIATIVYRLSPMSWSDGEWCLSPGSALPALICCYIWLSIWEGNH